MARVFLGVKGMTTHEGASKVKETLMGVDGVQRVDAGLDQQAAVEYDETELTVMDLIRTLRRQGIMAGMV